MQALLPTDRPTAVIQYTLTENRGVALVITRAGVDAVELPGLSGRRAWVLMTDWYKTYDKAVTPPNTMEAWADELPRRLDPMARAAVWPVVERLHGVVRTEKYSRSARGGAKPHQANPRQLLPALISLMVSRCTLYLRAHAMMEPPLDRLLLMALTCRVLSLAFVRLTLCM
jgi:hypothetical protein